MTITVSPRRVTAVLLAMVVLLVLAGVSGQFFKHVLDHDRVFGFVRLFDLDTEANVPTWYSSTLLLVAAVLLGVIGRSKHLARAPYAAHWTALAVIFLGLSIDEAASLHELTIMPLREALGARGALYYAWVIPGTAFVALVGLVYLRFLTRLPGRTRLLFLSAALLYVGGALGVEMIEGYWTDSYGEDGLTYSLITAVQETLEMVGVVVFIHALLSYLEAEVGALQIRCGTGGPARR